MRPIVIQEVYMRKALIDWCLIFGILQISAVVIGTILAIPFFIEDSLIRMVVVSIAASILFVMIDSNRERKCLVTLAIIHLFMGINSAFVFPIRYAGVAHLHVVFFANVFVTLLFLCLLWINHKRSEVQAIN